MFRKLIITKIQEQLIAALVENTKVVELHPIFVDECHMNQIYMGTIIKKVPSQNAFYIDIGNKTTCFLDAEKYRDLQCGMHIPIMIKKEASGLKKATATPELTLKGLYCIINSNQTGISFSKKIHRDKREEIRAWIKDSDNFHILVRTSAENATRENFVEEYRRLTAKIVELINAPSGNNRLLYSPSPYGIEYLQRLSGCTDGEIITDQKEVYKSLKDESNFPIRFYDDPILSLDVIYSISKSIKEALQEKVWLRSGGFLIIQKTEALTSIDVNTGKAIDSKNRLKSILHTNTEAAYEVARQLRLRNISGMILIDFINLDSSEVRKIYHNILQEEFKKDPILTEFIDETKLQLVEVIRKRQEPTFNELMKKGSVH